MNNDLIIKAPVNSLISARAQIAAGAGEIYLGYINEEMNNLSFTGRGKTTVDGIKTHVQFNEFKKIVKLAHENAVLVELTANMPMIGDDIYGGKKMQEAYQKYIEKAVDVGIDSVIIGDIGNLRMISRAKINSITITASTFLGTMNEGMLDMLYDYGVKKVVLPHHMTLDEIKSLVSYNPDIQIEIFGHFGCSFIESTCSLYHYASENISIGIPCRCKYINKNTGVCKEYLDMGEDCSLCFIDDIIKTGVRSIKIIGRELNYKLTSSIVKIYKEAINKINKGEKGNDMKRLIIDKWKLDWWENTFCKNKRCKYSEYKYFI